MIRSSHFKTVLPKVRIELVYETSALYTTELFRLSIFWCANTFYYHSKAILLHLTVCTEITKFFVLSKQMQKKAYFCLFYVEYMYNCILWTCHSWHSNLLFCEVYTIFNAVKFFIVIVCCYEQYCYYVAENF